MVSCRDPHCLEKTFDQLVVQRARGNDLGIVSQQHDFSHRRERLAARVKLLDTRQARLESPRLMEPRAVPLTRIAKCGLPRRDKPLDHAQRAHEHRCACQLGVGQQCESLVQEPPQARSLRHEGKHPVDIRGDLVHERKQCAGKEKVFARRGVRLEPRAALVEHGRYDTVCEHLEVPHSRLDKGDPAETLEAAEGVDGDPERDCMAVCKNV